MIGIAEQYLAAHLAQIARQHGLNRSLRAHRHKRWRLDHAVASNQAAETGLGGAVSFDYGKVIRHFLMFNFALLIIEPKFRSQEDGNGREGCAFESKIGNPKYHRINIASP
jgi:hypothetical protein